MPAWARLSLLCLLTACSGADANGQTGLSLGMAPTTLSAGEEMSSGTGTSGQAGSTGRDRLSRPLWSMSLTTFAVASTAQIPPRPRASVETRRSPPIRSIGRPGGASLRIRARPPAVANQRVPSSSSWT